MNLTRFFFAMWVWFWTNSRWLINNHECEVGSFFRAFRANRVIRRLNFSVGKGSDLQKLCF